MNDRPCNRCAHPLCNHITVLFIGSMQQHSELLTAESSEQIAIAKLLFYFMSQILQNVVAGIVAVGIVYTFKVINIQQ